MPPGGDLVAAEACGDAAPEPPGVAAVGPNSGEMAEQGEAGAGRMAEPLEIVANDLAARCWQHEIDHLNGVMFIEKMGPIARLASRGALKDFERKFREAQKKGEIPPDAELDRLFEALHA